MKRELDFKKYFRGKMGRSEELMGLGGRRGCGSDSQKPLVVRAHIERFQSDLHAP